MILAVQLPWRDLMCSLRRARGVDGLDEHRMTFVRRLNAHPIEDQHFAVWGESRPIIRKRLGELRIDVGDLVRIAPVRSDDPDPLDYATQFLRGENATEGDRTTVG